LGEINFTLFQIERLANCINFAHNISIDEVEISFNHQIYLLAINQDYVKFKRIKFLLENLIIEAYHHYTAFKIPLNFYIINHIIPFKYNASYGIISIQNKNAKKITFGTKDISSLIYPLNFFDK